MGNYLQKLQYFEQLAKSNKKIKHDKPVAIGSSKKRLAFLPIDSEENLPAAMETGLSFPCIVMLDLNGKLVNKKDSIRRAWYHTIWVLTKPAGAIAQPAAQNAYAETEAIMNEFISKMFDDFDTLGSCGPFKDLDLSTFTFEMTGAIGTGAFRGWKLSFSDEERASDITTFNPQNWEE